MSFKDFKAGLQNANDYLDTQHHLSGTQAVGTDAVRAVVQAEYTSRELLCGLLAGNGLKLPTYNYVYTAILVLYLVLKAYKVN